jgi:hypothetical protein
MQSRKWSLALLAAVVFATSCSGSGTSSPSNPPAPSPSPSDVANMAGTWRGTLASSNFATRTVTLQAVQTAVNCVDGTWTTDPAEWAGAISGLTGSGSFSGYVSFETPSGCTGYASIVTGQVDSTTLTWTSTGFSAMGSCDGGTPQSVVLKLQRQ